jgi:hypothetical protein
MGLSSASFVQLVLDGNDKQVEFGCKGEECKFSAKYEQRQEAKDMTNSRMQ